MDDLPCLTESNVGGILLGLESATRQASITLGNGRVGVEGLSADVVLGWKSYTRDASRDFGIATA